MKKITTIITLTLVVGMLAIGSMIPGQAWASSDGQPELSPPEGSDYPELIIEQDDSPGGGNEGDPDTTLDGPYYSGQGIFEGWEFDIPFAEELLEMLLVQLISVP